MGNLSNEKINPFHLSILIYMTQTGVTIFQLPNMLAEDFGTNGWLILPFIFLLAMLNIVLISWVYRLGEGKSVFEILEVVFPKWILFPLYFGLICLWGNLGSLIVKEYVLILQMLSLPTTPTMFLKGLVDVLVYLLLIKGIYNISKAGTIFFYMLIWLLGLVYFLFPEFQFSRVTPFFFQGETHLIKGFLDVFPAFLGYELSLLLIPYAEQSRKKFMNAIHISNLSIMFTYLILCFVLFGFYGYEDLLHRRFPLIDALAYIKLPFIERMESLLFVLFLFSIIITSVMYEWAALVTLQRLFPRLKTKWAGAVIVGTTFFLTMIPRELQDVTKVLDKIAALEIGVSFGLPLFLILLLLIIRRKVLKSHG
jgi:amino acid transporter